MASEETLQAITKHAMGDPLKFNELKERFESMKSWSPSAAAAIAYMIAKDELKAAKEEEEEPDVYDEVVEVLRKCWHPPGPISAHTAADEIFTLIYEWLDDEVAKLGYVTVRDRINELFQPFIIEKPKA